MIKISFLGLFILAKNKKVNIVKQIPNLLTLGNLFCGTLATIYAVQGNFKSTAFFVFLGIFFDFFDGFAARLLKVTGELGKQLDSLADMVTSGVVPGIVMFQLLGNKKEYTNELFDFNFVFQTETNYIQYIGLLLVLGSCYRLAKFNIDARQTNSFIGLPTPAMSLFVISLPLIQEYTSIPFAIQIVSNKYFLIVLTIVLTYLMNAEIQLFSLKFKNFLFKENIFKYIFLIISLILIFLLKIASIPVIIFSYIVLSILKLRYQSLPGYEKSKNSKQ